MECFFVHDSRQAKVCNQQIRIILGRSEEQIFGLQVTVHNSMVMEVGNSGKSGSNKVCGIRFVVRAFAAYAVEKFTTEGEVCD